MILLESILFAFHSLIANRLRTLLSLMGVVIGIFVIILILAAVDSLKKDVNESISSLGDDVVFIHKWSWEGGMDYPWWKYMLRPQPTVEEMEQVVKQSELTEAASYRTVANRPIKYKNNNIPSAEINGVGDYFEQVQSIEVSKGRFFSENEIRSGRNVAVLGYDIYDGLFGLEDVIGKNIKIAGKNFEVIGMLKKEGESLIGSGTDERVYIPYIAIRSIADMNNWRIHKEILVKKKENTTNAELKDELTGIMRSLRKLKPGEENDFSLNEASILAKETANITSILNIVGWVIGLLAIFVGGFGISNIMFVSVKERTNIIGIQKALGARKSFILMQFLVESLVLSLIGGLLGLFLVFISSLIVQSISSFNLVLSFSNIMTGIVISGIVGLISGIIPAYSAAQLDPVEAIRSK